MNVCVFTNSLSSKLIRMNVCGLANLFQKHSKARLDHMIYSDQHAADTSSPRDTTPLVQSFYPAMWPIDTGWVQGQTLPTQPFAPQPQQLQQYIRIPIPGPFQNMIVHQQQQPNYVQHIPIQPNFATLPPQQQQQQFF